MLGTRILEERKSKLNDDIKVVRSLGFGTYIQVSNLTQSGGIVESIWKQTLKKVHNSYPVIHNSIILGLGGGTVAKLIKKYWPQSEITGVEIDPVMVELGKKYLGLTNTKIIIQDAYEFITAFKKTPNSKLENELNADMSSVADVIEKSKEVYDLVIVDIYFGDKFPKKFEEESFLKLLTKNKLVIFNRLYFAEKRTEAVKFGNKLEKIFSKVDWFYPQANLMFICI